jgi:septum formation protein
MKTLVLASASPRRREILGSLGFDPLILPQDIDESACDHLPVSMRVTALAERKARCAAAMLPPSCPIHDAFILGADTLVCLEEAGSVMAFGKAADSTEARSMITRLAGRSHHVHTGLALYLPGSESVISASSDSLVSFAAMDAADIDFYIRTGDWEGAAGSYKIQGCAAWFIERIEGSWSGIVGLPIRELYGMLRKANFRPLPFGSGLPFGV